MSTAQDKFNKTFVEFVDDLSAAQPDSLELRMYAVALRGLMLASPDAALRTFYTEVTTPYAERILARDEAFFLERDYADTAADAELVGKIKEVYAGMGAADRDVVCKYMRMLVLLSRKVFEATTAA